MQVRSQCSCTTSQPITQQAGYDPANLEGQLSHSLASLILLSLPALLALGAHGVTHYLIRVTSHLQAHHGHASAAQPVQNPSTSARDDMEDSASSSSSSSAGNLFRGLQQQAAAVTAAAARVGADMAAESVQAARSTALAASRQLLSSIQMPSTSLPWSKQASPAMTTSSRAAPNRAANTDSLKSAASGPDIMNLASSSVRSASSKGTGGPEGSSTDLLQGGVSGLGLADLGPRQKVPTAAVGVAVGRSRPPQAFLQLAYGYLPVVWAGTLTHYLPAFLLQAGRILPVSLLQCFGTRHLSLACGTRT